MIVIITYQVSNIVWFDDDKVNKIELSIKFSNCNQPKDQWDDRDAIVDYLFDKFGEDAIDFNFNRLNLTVENK